MPDFLPLQLLLVTFAGWVNREQAQVIGYLSAVMASSYPSPSTTPEQRCSSAEFLSLRVRAQGAEWSYNALADNVDH
jgi:hypothetical protein